MRSIILILIILLSAPYLHATALNFHSGPFNGDKEVQSKHIQVGDSLYWYDVGTTFENQPVFARLTLRSSSDLRFTNIIFIRGHGSDMLIDVTRDICTADDSINCADSFVDLDFRLEFFERKTHRPVPLAFSLLFEDLDQKTADNYEMFTFNKSDLYSLVLEDLSLLKTASSETEIVVSSSGSLQPHRSSNGILGHFNKTQHMDFNIQIGKNRQHSRIFIDGNANEDYFSNPAPADISVQTDSPLTSMSGTSDALVSPASPRSTAECPDAATLSAGEQLICTTLEAFNGLWKCENRDMNHPSPLFIAYADEQPLLPDPSESPLVAAKTMNEQQSGEAMDSELLTITKAKGSSGLLFPLLLLFMALPGIRVRIQ